MPPIGANSKEPRATGTYRTLEALPDKCKAFGRAASCEGSTMKLLNIDPNTKNSARMYGKMLRSSR